MRLNRLSVAIDEHLQSRKVLAPDAATVRSMYSPFADPLVVLHKCEKVDIFVDGIYIDRRIVKLPRAIKLSDGTVIQYIEDGDYHHELKLVADFVLGTCIATIKSFEYTTQEYVYFEAHLMSTRRTTHFTKPAIKGIGYLNDQQ